MAGEGSDGYRPCESALANCRDRRFTRSILFLDSRAVSNRYRDDPLGAMVMREGFLLVGAGVGMALAGSLALTRTIRSLLFEVGPGTQPR